MFPENISVLLASILMVVTQADPNLVQVHVLFRHGARTPSYYYPTDPNRNNKSFYPEGFGGLTNEGKMGVFQLGQQLRQLYDSLLGEEYTEEKIRIRSTDYVRTKMCAQLVAAGLFPPGKLQSWNKNLQWQPIPYEYKNLDEEDLFHPWHCQYKLKTIHDQLNLSEVQKKFIQPNKVAYNFLANHSGLPMTNPADVLEIHSILLAESNMNLTLPSWARAMFPEPIQSLAATVYGYNNWDRRVEQINSGYLLKKILNDTHAIVFEPEGTHKMYLYSGHEETVGTLINSLGIYNDHVPHYTSALIFEIYEKSRGELFIKLKFRDGLPPNRVVDLKMPKCDILCPLAEFEALYKDILPQIPIEQACKI